MDETRCRAREIRRKFFKDKYEISISHGLNEELVEDILSVSPEVHTLHFELLADSEFETSLLPKFRSLLQVGIWTGHSLEYIDLNGISDIKSLVKIVISVQPTKGLDELDISPLGGLENLEIVNILCPVRKLMGIDELKKCPQLHSLQLASLDVKGLDLSGLSGSNLQSLHINDVGQQYPEEPYKIVIPQDTPLSEVVVSDCYSPDLKLDIDYSWLEEKIALDHIAIINCNLTSFDLQVLSSLERIGKIDLTGNQITHLDITSIIEIPMFTENTLGESAFNIDENVVIQISVKKQDTIKSIIQKPDKVIEEHKGYFSVIPEFGHKWLKKLIDKHDLEWI
ncbi:MAG: hypothetical protein BAJATHORv1_60057 [Candidatus Thorarchaeota archaeon]|nr:MAG: hypothetical protein BAJATHORv1_60057 [Candidatus Thorarchaeota archaeon]